MVVMDLGKDTGTPLLRFLAYQSIAKIEGVTYKPL